MLHYYRKLVVLITMAVSVVLLVSCAAPAQAPVPAQEESTGAESVAEEQEPTPEVNPEKTVTLALPEIVLEQTGAEDPIVFVSVPLAEPPTTTTEGLRENEEGVVIGVLEAHRELPLPDEQQLPPDEYVVKVQDGRTVFVGRSDGDEEASLPADVRSLEEREVDPPETIVTTKDICYSWYKVQVCTEPGADMALTEEEKDIIQTEMRNAVGDLAEAGLLEREDINVDGTMPDMLGETATQEQRASLLVAPIVEFPTNGEDRPVDGALLGAMLVLLPIDGLEHETVPPGAYAARAVEQGPNEWMISLESAAGGSMEVPAKYIEVRGKAEDPEPPMAILLQIRIILCWGEC